MKTQTLTITTNIITAAKTNNEVLALRAHDELIENCTSIDRYYVLKWLKTACRNKNSYVFNDFAKLTINSKHGAKAVFTLLLNEIYNINDVDGYRTNKSDYEIAYAGMGNLENYVTKI